MTTEIIENECTLHKFQLFPNPVSETLNVTISNPSRKNESLIFEIYDIHGRIVLSENFNLVGQNQSFSLDVERLPESIYSFQIKNSLSNLGGKIFIKN